MIQNVRETGMRLKVRPAERLRVHFLALARRIQSWEQTSGLDDASGISVGVTSTEHRTGCTMVSFNTAAALASLSHEPVLFVETQYSTSGFAKKVPRPGYGLSEVLDGSQNPAACVCQTNVDNLFVMSCGRVSGHRAMELPIEALASINPELCNTFRYVVFDLPVAEETNVCYPIVQHLDGVLIVNQPSIDQSKIQRILKRVQGLDSTVIGLVLNKT